MRGTRPRSALGVDLLTTGRTSPSEPSSIPRTRDDDPVGNLFITISPTRPVIPLPFVRVRFRTGAQLKLPPGAMSTKREHWEQLTRQPRVASGVK